ncbi:hypothetical protein L2Y94_04155 [Luteibacter aegosomatis]|uniref:hypothetical protein n=1 Tax=Luteibacter aegosomatis TaxID=2911537 RepID=UPI001FF76009|nr:hypothetical protein [Luteibacter aegosomatis]UPG86558.1 hypothetical protein L2Y94_04155 [Luteibacter aegosomatis]
MRRTLLSMLLLMPLAAAGHGVSEGLEGTGAILYADPAPVEGADPQSALPMWRTPDGRTLSVRYNDRADPTQPLAPRPLGASPYVSSGLQYDLGPRLQAHASVSGQGWINSAESCGASATSHGDRCTSPGAPPRIVGSEVGATWRGSGYSVGLGVGSTRPSGNSPALPRVLPGMASTMSGLPFGSLSSSTELNAHGRLDLDGRSGLDLGASIGRIRLLPGNLLGIGSVDQKALSLGVDRGPLYGTITGRTMQPEAGVANGLNTDRRWSAIDLGVTFRLPWRGELSVGAQNVWSSGTTPNNPALPEPDQSRTPYVQYHQDL